MKIKQKAFARQALAALSLLVVAPWAAASPVTYHLVGSFTGVATNKPEFVAAITPLLTGQSLSLSMTVDPSVGSSPSNSGGFYTLYRAITGSTARFAGFETTSTPCPPDAPNSSEFICAVQTHDGSGFLGGGDADRVTFLPAISISNGFDAATGLNRPLFLQFIMFAQDITGQTLADEGLTTALSTLEPARMGGRLGVFAADANGQFSDFASFEFRLSSISTDALADLPEPGSLALTLITLITLIALAGLGTVRRRPGPKFGTTAPRSRIAP